MNVRTITVLGAGTMGHGIAHAAVSSGFETRLYDVSDTQLARARATNRGCRDIERRKSERGSFKRGARAVRAPFASHARTESRSTA